MLRSWERIVKGFFQKEMGSDLIIDFSSVLAAESGNDFQEQIGGGDLAGNSLLLNRFRGQAEEVFISCCEKIGFHFFAQEKIMVVLWVSGESDVSRNLNMAGKGPEAMNFILDNGDDFAEDFLSEL